VERMSDVIDPTDRSISFLLGDGAGAVVVGASDTPGIGPTVWGSDGSQAQLINQTYSWQEAFRDKTPWPTLQQEGASVFKWAVWTMAPIAQQAMDAAGVTPDQIEAFIPHQANMRIIDQMVKQLKLPESVVIARDIADTGNTSAASIPLATERLLREGQVPSGALALQIGFGAGLVYAAQVVALP
ncbi:MAG TPA: 3-oxoacyl-[acyl-carrier-protein] synthase III C-terminal domain-containing protein, partial [Polyangiaceae bacterium]|nr:3-oxoacyl-[acyl-carrier-protein] synthase III C-terminal domain-containing protein [Polyangiaceae bacterium]